MSRRRVPREREVVERYYPHLSALPRPDAPTDPPCRCRDSHAAITPTHSGHCCFVPASQTCHPQEVAEWEAERDRRHDRIRRSAELYPQGGQR